MCEKSLTSVFIFCFKESWQKVPFLKVLDKEAPLKIHKDAGIFKKPQNLIQIKVLNIKKNYMEGLNYFYKIILIKWSEIILI